jgi:hypothetical protein
MSKAVYVLNKMTAGFIGRDGRGKGSLPSGGEEIF